MAQKVGEEGVETVIAALTQDRERQTSEIADLFYHTLVLMAELGLSMDDIEAELQRRHAPR
jgi:phosphoribosyl-ATP pyrophosphohydrolase